MKTKKYTLGNVDYIFTKWAKESLEVYRDAIGLHFWKESKDILSDIDAAIAQKIDASIKNRTDKVINDWDIEKIIQELGTIEQITDQPELSAEATVIWKKLYRDMNNKWIWGVCSGLASYLGFPIWIVRVAFLIAVIAPISSVLPYLLLWYLVPPTKTKSDTLQMQGIPLSLSSLSNTQWYIRKRVIWMAKLLGMLLALLALILTAFMGIGMVFLFLGIHNDDASTHGTTVYNYTCDNTENVIVLRPNRWESSIMVWYRDVTQEYFHLYTKDDEIVYGGNAFPANETLQFSFISSTLDLEVFDRDTWASIDTCEVISIQKGSDPDIGVINNLKDFSSIDTCLDAGKVWDYRTRACIQ